MRLHEGEVQGSLPCLGVAVQTATGRFSTSREEEEETYLDK